MNFVLIIIAFLIFAVAYVKLKEVRHHLFYKTIAIVVVLFLGSIAYVWIKSGINLSTYNGFLSLGKTYYSWLGTLVGNVVSLTGDVVKHDWGINSTVIPSP